jgi:hypoxanthine phosphoribosyltransferase
MKDLYVSWDEYNRLVEKLALKVYDSGWNFDAIVCLARGGLRVGDVLSRLFDRPLGVLFTSSYREEEGTRQSRLMIG